METIPDAEAASLKRVLEFVRAVYEKKLSGVLEVHFQEGCSRKIFVKANAEMLLTEKTVCGIEH